MNVFLMLAYRHVSDPCNSVLIDLIETLKYRNIKVDIGIAQDLVLQPSQKTGEHDLYVLKSHSNLWLSLAGVLQQQGARILNPFQACIAVQNKILATQRMQSAGIPVPETWLTGDLNLMKAVAAEKTLIIKPYIGSRGEGMYIVHEPEELLAIPPPQEPVMVQEFIDGSGEDLKVYVIHEDVFAVRKPFSPTGYKVPGIPCPVSPDIREIALNCGRVFGLGLYGIDIIESSSGPVVVDLNYFPSYKGVPRAVELLSDYIIEYGLGRTPDLMFSTPLQAASQCI